MEGGKVRKEDGEESTYALGGFGDKSTFSMISSSASRSGVQYSSGLSPGTARLSSRGRWSCPKVERLAAETTRLLLASSRERSDGSLMVDDWKESRTC
jgi:hypothetical protein